MANVVLGVTGGIAAYKAAEVASRLVKGGHSVRCAMTRHAAEFIAPLTLRSITNAPVALDLFEEPKSHEIEHIALAKWADVFAIAPATANILGKMASGIADDFLSTAWLATEAPVLVAPAMNTHMYAHPVTQRNLETLRRIGVHFVGPDSGRLACGDTGEGRMSEPAEIVQAIEALLARKGDLAGLRVLVTAGPTREPIDPVRYLTNHSSGKMGYAIAEAALRRGASVCLITGPVNLPAPKGAEVVPVVTTGDLYAAVMRHAPGCQIVVQAAAPADFRPEAVSEQKIKKQGDDPLALTLVPNPDVAAALGRQKAPGQVLVGFAADTERLVENARLKLVKKNCDLIVANDVTQAGAGFGVDTNIVTFVTAKGEESLPKLTKAEVADALLDRALSLRA